MRIELLPILLGILVALIGGAAFYDAAGDPESGPLRERRRRIRTSIDRPGEGMVGAGTFLLGIALMVRDSWDYASVVVLAGAVLILAGAYRNREYLRETFLFRGAARRGEEQDEDPSPRPPKLRIR